MSDQPTCTCMAVDGYLIKRISGCPKHGAYVPPPTQEPAPKEITDAEAERACAWADYRKVGAQETAAHKAFLAGWDAARNGDQSGVLR